MLALAAWMKMDDFVPHALGSARRPAPDHNDAGRR